MIFQARDFRWNLEKQILMMGVINITPDSFSDGGECPGPREVLARARQFREAGADILDLGAESTRPRALPVSEEEEFRRLEPALEAVLGEIGLPVSVDTTKSQVAEKALAQGASIINDVSGLRCDARIAEVTARFKAGLVIMHRRGNPANMQSLAHYEDLVGEVLREIKEGIDIALKAGISYEHLVVDPGIGFAKTKDQNLSLIKNLHSFKVFQRPILIGTSRKSFIGEILAKQPRDRVFGTAASVALSVERGASIVRVHDVREMRDVVRVTEAILNAR